ncbi:DUF5806 family protein [Salinigranum sp. GCM10025319]|uniref:DUF5806 family protein n=1 Tax=Salinigranum sp. GCM10025319 TaxID=3252687 RepID=UPI00361A8799
MGDDPAATNGEETTTEPEAGPREADDASETEADANDPPASGGDDRSTPTGDEAAGDVDADVAIETDDALDSDSDEGDATDHADDARSGDSDVEAGDSTNGEHDDPSNDRPPADVRKYERFKKVDGAQYDRVNDFLRERTYITAREWAIARLCADFRTETGVEMTKIGDNLPYLVPFMTDTYSPQAVNQARHAFREKVRKSGATFLYGAMCGFFTAEELDELMYEVSEIAKFLLEVEGVDLAVAEELDAEERISSVMREVREASSELRAEDLAESASE